MRQGILGIFVLLFFRYVLLIKNKLGYKLLGMLFLIIIGIFIIKDVQTDAFQSLKEATTFEELVNRPYAKALMIIDEYPLLGKGLGGYSDNGSIAYPHNIFLEIISEVGFVGLLMILIISLQAMSYNKFSWRALNANGTYAILLLLAIFIRVNASGDLCENIYFFALLFSMRDRRGLAKRTVK